MREVLGSEETKGLVRQANARDRRFYDETSGIPLYPTNDNQILFTDLDRSGSLELLKDLGFEYLVTGFNSF